MFVLHAKALTGNPYDGHNLCRVIEETEALTGRQVERAYVEKVYRRHDAPRPRSVFICRQKPGVYGVIKRDLRHRSAIGHMKNEDHLGRNFLKGHRGDQANIVLTAVRYNFRLLLAWMSRLCVLSS